MDAGKEHAEERTGVRIGNHALQMGWITPEQLREALAEQARDPGTARKIGLILVAKGFLTGDQLRVLVERQKGDAAKALHPSMQGKPFGKYLLRRELGRGAHGVVWEAHDSVLGRSVALKLLRPRPDLPPSEVAVHEQRFLREARTLAGLPKHPHVVDVYDAGVIDGQWFLAMEYVPGVPLDRWAQGVSLRARIALLRDAALAIQHAHESGVLHRDLKPKNIIVDERSRPRITDFGLARNLTENDGRSLTASDVVVGTPAYLSPEQVDSRLKRDERVDVYSLGVILYEMLTGKVPFSGSTSAEVLVKASRDPVEKPSQTLRPEGMADVDKTLEAVCLKALARRPQDRTRTAQAFADALTRWLDPAARPPAVRKGFVGKALGLALLAAAGFGAAIAWNAFDWAKDTPGPSPAPALPGLAPLGRNAHGCDEYRNLKDGSIMVAIPEGEFWMGSADGPEEERPRRRVYVDGFLLDKTEVTVEQFRRFVEATGYITEAEEQGWAYVFGPAGLDRQAGAHWKQPGFLQTDAHPVTCVTWRDAVAYCNWAGKRLPTEAEWEKGARGTDGRAWPWGPFVEQDRAHVHKPAAATAPVGSFPRGASPYGILDMAGNVTEVCSDWFDSQHFKSAALRNPRGPAQGKERVLKGGAWVDEPSKTRSTRRFGAYPADWGLNNADGFRGARDLVRGR